MNNSLELENYLKSNPELLHSKFKETGLKFNKHPEAVRAVARKLRKEEERDNGAMESFLQEKDVNPNDFTVKKLTLNRWGKMEQIKVQLDPKKQEQLSQEQFIEFLRTYVPKSEYIQYNKFNDDLDKSMLVVNLQDAHYNKYDINGDNDIHKRFLEVEYNLLKVLNKVILSSELEEIIFVVGSDMFNSEWTGTTTKGTIQTNILQYHQSFEEICKHLVRVINTLLKYGKKLTIPYIPGNHDFHVGWHLINWLKAYYKDQKNLVINDSTLQRKYFKYGITGLLLNHGCGAKPKDLANIFPIEFKNEWSSCSDYVIITGDKHRGMESDFGGIRFYGLPALSTAVSGWDDNNGYSCNRCEITCMLFDKEIGLTDILKQRSNGRN